METIRVEEVCKEFGAVRALDRVDLRIEPGELFFLLGPSGCGKSTLLRCIAGLEQPDRGVISFGGVEVNGVPPHRRGTAMVFQSYALWPHMTVAQNIAFGLEERRVPRAEIRVRVEEALERVKLGGFGTRTIDQMSGGQQQRVALARALVVRPKCLLLDEPLSNLDARLRIEMRREIRNLVKEHGLTAVYVTHDQEEALAMADRMAILTAGRVAQVGPPDEVYRAPRSSEVAAFIGETNLLDGRLAGVAGRRVEVETVLGVFSGQLTDPKWEPAAGEAVKVSIRPEAWRLHGMNGGNETTGRVTERSYLGQRIQYWIETAAGPQQVVEMNPHQLHAPGGDPVRLQVAADDVVVVRN